MSKSVARVEAALAELGLIAEVLRMPETTRSAADAARACGCDVSQIVKSLVFEGADTGELKLVLLGGHHELDMAQAEGIFGEGLKRADPKRVRNETGFAIGGVAPLGHIAPMDTWMDESLLAHDKVWAAAGAPNAVFCVDPAQLAELPNVRRFLQA
ncbi:prolyl-tRNA editing enzyme YbaK/EbsC (Cys-tRNA(Pro) deacylase) [Shimia isoporae]|uniref:Prolyl-tRNA editing enzyme YbaK/EbsC (Cys-tRNA(Pro) deacylase) n=1 Tax=Shimia isoporae TaxID=647720 RepID=A0A4R1NK88_9RHOB|nr:YbaK/EbsC family protein [Shimia isoporae]TCL08041.1 prolyl-tRNA editing enzyme YbaK/EbsC (Cys-tRNA(Pro) deacylase) [Shimia isoporae]